MPPLHATQRPRIFHACASGAAPKHGHIIEYLMGVTNILVQVGFLVGSVLFLSSNEDNLRWGDILFITGSIITFVFAGYNLFESYNHWKHFFSEEREDCVEFFETSCFFVAGLIFMFGSFFYWPGVYDNWCGEGCTEAQISDMEFRGESWGAFLFICGSLGFVIASMLNAIGLGMNKQENEENNVSKACHYIHVFALIFSQLGSVLFTVGSFLYRPSLNNHCSQLDPRYDTNPTAAEGVAEEACVSTSVVGTNLYIAGSALYVAESLLNFVNSILKGKFIENSRRKPNPRGIGSDDEESSE